jgi:hypothetical protein
MPENAAIAAHLEGFREGLVADGYDLLIDGFANGTAKLRITAGPDACEECLVPKKLMVSMLEESLRELADVRAVEVAYPGE